jgi:hypothetical protein
MSGRLDAVVLLVRLVSGDTGGVYFMSRDDARDWQDEHADTVTVVGCVSLVSRNEALA